VRIDEATIQIFGREMRVSLEGLTPMEVSALADQVTEKMKEIQQHSGTADSSKLAMLACLHYAADLQQLRDRVDSGEEVGGKRIDDLIEKLESSLK